MVRPAISAQPAVSAVTITRAAVIGKASAKVSTTRRGGMPGSTPADGEAAGETDSFIVAIPYSGDHFMVLHVGVADGVISPPDRVGILEPPTDVRFHVMVVRGRDMERLAIGVLAELALVDDDSSGLDDVARQLEHRLLVLARRINRDIGIGPRSEVALGL